MATTGVSILFGRLKLFCFVTSGLQNIHVDIDIENICGLESDSHFVKWLPLKSLKCSVLD